MDKTAWSEDLRERPVGELFGRLSEELATLIRQEMALARAELTDAAKHMMAAGGLFGGSALLALGGVGALTACFVLNLSLILAPWLAAFIVAVTYLVMAVILVGLAKKKMAEMTPIASSDTVDTLKEDVKWAKSQVKSVKR